MDICDTDRATLMHQEEELWREATRFDRLRMDQLLTPDFWEVGMSGRVYDRTTTINVQPQPIGAQLPFTMRVDLLGPDIAQVTYTSIDHCDGPARHARRSSIWVRSPSGWRLRFHQGTPYTA